MGRFISYEDRRRVATGWDPRVSTLREYARSVGYSERAIRNWRARLRHEGGTAMPTGTSGVPLQATVDALQARLGDLERAVDAARAAVAACRAAVDAMPALSDDEPWVERPDEELAAEAPVTPSAATPPEAEVVRPVPMPSPGFFRF